MTPFTVLEAPACPLGLENVDTDQLIPARFMQTPRASGYGGFLLHDLRRDETGALRDDFALNDPRYAGAQVMIGRANFGCGSSREAAVYVLADAGFRCVLAPSFGDIFASNCVQNGVLPASLSRGRYRGVAARRPRRLRRADQDRSAGADGDRGQSRVSIRRAPDWKTRLVNGWDAIDITQSYGEAISKFLERDAGERPWARPRTP